MCLWYKEPFKVGSLREREVEGREGGVNSNVCMMYGI